MDRNETEERYRLAARATRDAIWDWEFATNHVLWNEALQDAFGHPPDAVQPTGEWWVDHIHPDDRDRVSHSIHAAIDGTAESWADEYRFRRADGSYADVLDRGHIIREPGGRATRMIGAMLDLSERRQAEAVLRESETRLRLATDAAEIGFWDVDVVNDILIWPPRVKAMFGVSPDAPVSMADFYNGLHPDDRDRTATAYAAAADPEQRALYDVEYRTVGKEDGVIRSVAAKGRGIFDDNNRCVRVIGVAIDVTHRKRTEAQLAESQARYRTLFEAIDAGFCVVEVDLGDDVSSRIDYRVIEANPAFYSQTGFPSDILGRWLREAAPTLEEHWFETYGRIARTRVGERFEQGSDSLGRWFDVSAFPIGESADRRVAILFNDISARRMVEIELAKLNRELEQRVADRTAERDGLWRSSQDLLLVAEFDATILSVNPAWSKALGWTETELVGRSFMDFIHPDDLEASSAEASRLAADGRTTPQFENRYRRKDGSWAWLSWAVSAQGDRFYGVARDVTGEKETALELERAQEALRQAQKMEAVGQLTGGLAHDFNNLLAGISGSLEMLETRIEQGRLNEVERYLHAAQGAARRAASLTHRLLAFSRRQTLTPKPTNVNTLISGMEELIRRSVGPAIQIEVVGAAGLWPTLVDHSQLESALLNLCINARDAMPDGGRITIETANKWLDRWAARPHNIPEGQYLSLCVTDTGTGMTPDVKAKAFDPFFTTKPIGQGTGLGLSMIYGFAQQSGGQVRIYSEVGQGTTVCIYLPRHHGDVGEDVPVTLFAEPARSGSGETVLVVDDEPTVRMLITDLLHEMGYLVIEAADSAAGLKILHSDVPIDLLITDVGLPGGMNGRQMADAGRSRRPALKVMFITGYAENAMLNAGHLEPGMSVITKPFAVEVMAARIREMVGTAA